jgi:hypothetical protein
LSRKAGLPDEDPFVSVAVGVAVGDDPEQIAVADPVAVGVAVAIWMPVAAGIVVFVEIDV